MLDLSPYNTKKTQTGFLNPKNNTQTYFPFIKNAHKNI